MIHTLTIRIVMVMTLTLLYGVTFVPVGHAKESAVSSKKLKQNPSASPEFTHSVQGFAIPLILLNTLQLAYEYKVFTRLGLRVDGFAVVSLGGNVYAISIGPSVIALEGRSSRASHGFELGLSAASGLGGGGLCNADIEACDQKTFYLLKGFFGYRYQSFGGFQLRAGLAPILSFDADAGAVLPELTLGLAF